MYGFSNEIRNGLFDKLIKALKYLGDKKLLSNILHVETRYKELKKITPHQNLFKDLDGEYGKIKGESLKNATQYIKNHLDEFFVFKEC